MAVIGPTSDDVLAEMLTVVRKAIQDPVATENWLERNQQLAGLILGEAVKRLQRAAR